MSKVEKRTLIIILFLLILIVITIGISYAIFSYIGFGQTDNIIKTGSISFLYTENGNSGNGISIVDAFPISDEEGKKQMGSGKVFEFSIVGKTPKNSSLSYEITAQKISDLNSIPSSFVKLYLTEYNGVVEEALAPTYDKTNNRIKTYNELDISTNKETTDEKTIYNGIILEDTINYEKNFRLRMWLDDSMDISPIDSSTGINRYNNMSFSIKVNVYVNDALISNT